VATLILLWLAAMMIEKVGAVRSTLDGDKEQALRIATRVLLWLVIALEVAVLLALMELHTMLTGG
jgi:hypothetical protein